MIIICIRVTKTLYLHQDLKKSADSPGTEDILSPSSSISCSQEDDGDQTPFELTCTCKPHHSVHIAGIDIVSEARTLELYTDLDGYLKSSRGKLVMHDGNEDDGDQPRLYGCRIQLDEQVDKLTIKFLGLDTKPSFSIYKLELVLMQKDGNSSISKTMPGTIDMSKVKGYLHDMGDTIPDNAMQLLQSVEQYQKTQMSSLQNAFSSSRSSFPSGSNNSDRLAGLLTMVTRIGSLPTSSSASQQSCDSDSTNQNKGQPCDTQLTNQSTDNDSTSSTNFGPLQTLMMAMSGSHSSSQGHSGVEGQGQDVMYKMLQGICGKVSEIRQSENDKSEPVENTETSRSENPDEHSTDISPGTPSGKAEINMEQLQTALEKTVSQMIHSSEERLVKYIDTSLSAMETRINNKLDSMMQALQKNGHPPSTE